MLGMSDMLWPKQPASPGMVAHCPGCGAATLGTTFCGDNCEVLTQMSTIHLRQHAFAIKDKGKSAFLAKEEGGRLVCQNWPKELHIPEGVTMQQFFQSYKNSGFKVLHIPVAQLYCNLLHRLRKGPCLLCKETYYNDVSYATFSSSPESMIDEEFTCGTFCSPSCATLYFAGDHQLIHLNSKAQLEGQECYQPSLVCYPYSRKHSGYKNLRVCLPDETGDHDSDYFAEYLFTRSDIANELRRREELNAPASTGPLEPLVRRRK